MARFDIHENPNPETRADFPYLMDVQFDLFTDLRTRIVIPLARLRSDARPMERLTPVIEVLDEPFVLLTPQLAGIGLDALGKRVAAGAAHRDAVVQALDFMITGS